MQLYKAAVQQEEDNVPAYVRLQQQAEAKEEEERAEKKRLWEEQVASKKFWVSKGMSSCTSSTQSGSVALPVPLAICQA